MRIAIDFDGVIHDHKHPPPGKVMGPPMPGAVEAVKALRDAGHDLTIFTARPEDIHIQAWLRYFQFPDLPITNIKQDWDLLIDDKAMRFDGDWIAVLQEFGLADLEGRPVRPQKGSPSESADPDVVREV